MTRALWVRQAAAWVRRGSWSGVLPSGVPGPMRNVVASIPAGTTDTVRIADELPDGGASVTGIRRTRNDPSGSLGGPFSIVDQPGMSYPRSGPIPTPAGQKDYRDFIYLTPSSTPYTVTSEAVNGNATPPAYGAPVSAQATLTPPVVVQPEQPGAGVRTTSASPVRRAQDVVLIKGVTMHAPRTQYENFTAVLAFLDFTGIKRVRTGFGTAIASSTKLAQIKDLILNGFRPRGITLCLVLDMDDWSGGSAASTDAQMATIATQMVTYLRDMGILPDVAFIETDNEPSDADLEKARRRTVAIHNALKADPAAAHIVRGTSSLADTNSAWKYQALGANGGVPNAQAVTFHDYPGVDRMMSGPVNPSDNGYAITNTMGRNGRFVLPTPSGVPLQILSTENAFSSGTTGDGGKNMPDAARAVQEPRIWLEHARGIPSGDRAIDVLLSCNYEMRDRGTNSDTEDRFGMADVNWNPKAPARSIRNYMLLLNDPGATSLTFTPGALGHSWSGADNDFREEVMQKTDGSWWIAYWQEWVTWDGSTIRNPAPRNMTLHLPSSRTVTSYNPVVGTDGTGRGAGTNFALQCGAVATLLRIA